MASTELAPRQHGSVSQSDWQIIREQAASLVPTGFLPAAIKTPEQAVAIILKGRELGIPPMYALSNIAVIQGKPAANAELMLALIYRDHGDDAIQFVEATSKQAVISYKRRSWRERQTFAFTIEDARTAGLSGGNWSKYPGAMLRARCISAVARLAFPDSIGGMYTPEELGGSVNEETGEIVPGEHTAPLSHVRGDLPPPTVVQGGPIIDSLRLVKWREKYETLAGQALADFDIVAPSIPDDADEETVARMGRELREQIEAAKQAEAV